MTEVMNVRKQIKPTNWNVKCFKNKYSSVSLIQLWHNAITCGAICPADITPLPWGRGPGSRWWSSRPSASDCWRLWSLCRRGGPKPPWSLSALSPCLPAAAGCTFCQNENINMQAQMFYDCESNMYHFHYKVLAYYYCDCGKIIPPQFKTTVFTVGWHEENNHRSTL